MSEEVAVSLRRARTSDASLLFEFVNMPDCLAQKLKTTEPVSWDDHQRWFAQRLSDPNTRLFIIEKSEKPIGQVRLQRGADGVPEVDIYVTQEARHRHMARAALTAAIEDWREAFEGEKVRASIKSSNGPSLALFKSLGFSQVSGDLENVVMEFGGENLKTEGQE
jgi:UDP-2,4-diacetamido-2,4,6-trideoxy-beta-L-altropyranose hydrolase